MPVTAKLMGKSSSVCGSRQWLESQPLRNGLQEECIHEAEDRQVSADTESQRKNCNQSEAGMLQQHPRAVAQVLPNFFNPAHTARIAAFLLGLLDPTECFASRISRVFRAHSQPNVLLSLLFDVVAQFLVQFALDF